MAKNLSKLSVKDRRRFLSKEAQLIESGMIAANVDRCPWSLLLIDDEQLIHYIHNLNEHTDLPSILIKAACEIAVGAMENSTIPREAFFDTMMEAFNGEIRKYLIREGAEDENKEHESDHQEDPKDREKDKDN